MTERFERSAPGDWINPNGIATYCRVCGSGIRLNQDSIGYRSDPRSEQPWEYHVSCDPGLAEVERQMTAVADAERRIIAKDNAQQRAYWSGVSTELPPGPDTGR